MNRKNGIYAVIVSFNPNLDLLEAEYRSISPQVEKIVYVDNNSKNREGLKLWYAKKRDIEIIWLDDNEGIGFAQNTGIKLALKEGAEHIILFDQDSVVDDNLVECLYEMEQKCMEEGVNVGIIGPIYSSYDGRYDYPILSIEEGKLVQIPMDSFSEYKKVSHIIASGELIRRNVFDQVGLMREDFFIEYVDFEFCFRVALNGFSIVVTKKARMKHQIGDSQIMIGGRQIGIYMPFRRYFCCRNSVLLVKEKNIPKVFSKHYLKLSFGKFLVGCLYGPHRWLQFRYCIRGYMDGLRNISGKCMINS